MARVFECEETKAWILTAIIKLHSGMAFVENEKVNKVIADYSKSKNVEIQ